MAAVAAVALVLSMVLPWYQKSFVPQGAARRVRATCRAFGVFTFVEAAILLVAAGVLFLVWARSQRQGLPPARRRRRRRSSLAGGWAVLLLVWRLFDKPDDDGAGATVGIQWGIFVALARRGRADRRGRARARRAPARAAEPGAEDLDWESAAPRPRRRAATARPRDATAVTEVLRERPGWEGEPPDAPGERRRARDPDPDTPPDRLF